MTTKMEKEFLPIEDFREEILESVEENSAVIITAETGAGKTTQVPQYLAEAGYRVVITQPRRLAATSVAMRVAEEMAVEIGGSEVGYRTAYETCDSNSEILLCTDGLQLVREITGHGRAQVLVIDEVHEWNINIETLVAWAKKRLAEGCDFKVVIMSATLDAEKLSAFFDNCPVIEVPGRLYPVEEKQSLATPADEAAELAKQGRNVLVFQPGKQEIEETISHLRSTLGDTAEVIPLHGQLEAKDQRVCFRHFEKAKVIVSTNVAQTSVTIPDIDAVVDSGLERRVELANGIEGLYLKEISHADCKQRAGRAGRTKEGVYILCGKASGRQQFPTAEIQRVRLDQLVLRLAAAGFDATELEFFHQPDKTALLDAKRALHALGAMSQDGKVTKTGHLMAKLPCSVQYARMIVEANRLGVADDVLTIAAILEVGGLRDRTNAWRAHTKEKQSDLLVELDLWNACRGIQNGQIRETGVFSKAYYKAKEIRQHLAQMTKKEIRFGTSGDRENILRACTAGMVDHLYQNRYGEYHNGKGGARQMARESVVTESPTWIVGLPKDIEFTNRKGRKCVLNLVSMTTKVDPSWLLEVAPQLAAEIRRNYRFSSEKQAVVCDLVSVFNGQEVKTELFEADGCEEATKALADGLASQWLESEEGKAVNAELSELEAKSACAARGKLNRDEIVKIYVERLGNAYTIGQITDRGIDLTLSRSMFVSDEDANYIRQENPDTVTIGNEVCEVSYSFASRMYYYETKQTVAVKVSVVTVQAVSQPEVENLIPSGASYQLAVKDEGYTSISGTDVLKLCEEIEKRRLDTSWEQFQHDNPSREVEIKGLEPLPELPEPKIYDSMTGSFAFSAYCQNSWGDWYQKWFCTQEEANTSQAKALEAKAKLDAEEDEKRNRDRYMEEAKAELQAVRDIFAAIDLDKYEDYDLSEREAGKSSWYKDQSLVYQLEQIEPLLKENDGYYRRTPEPKKALELLTTVRARIETALDYKARNEGMKETAENSLSGIQPLVEASKELASAGEFSLTQENCEALESLGTRVRRSVEAGRFLPAVEMLWENTDLVNHAKAAKIELDRMIAAGEILINFTAWHRGGGTTNCGDGWVIRPDGSQRKRDTDDVRCYKSDGNYVWKRVEPEELALRWSCSHMGDIAGNSTFQVAKRPVGEITEAQAERVSEIEREIGAPEGAFGLCPEIAARNAERLAAIKNAAAKIIIDLPEFSYQQVASENGVGINDARLLGLFNPHGTLDESCDGRSAEAVMRTSAAGGVLEFLVYEKYGQENLNMRWRPLRDGEEIKSLSQEQIQLRSELNGQLRGLESRLENINRELRDCENGYSRVKLTFELDCERGTLFAIANVTDISVEELRSHEWKTLTGAVRFVCDPTRCKWMETPPAVGETWVSTWGKMIGRDNKGRPIIIANPQARIDEKARRAIEAKIEKIKAEIETKENPASTTELDQESVKEESTDGFSLADLKAKFKKT